MSNADAEVVIGTITNPHVFTSINTLQQAELKWLTQTKKIPQGKDLIRKLLEKRHWHKEIKLIAIFNHASKAHAHENDGCQYQLFSQGHQQGDTASCHAGSSMTTSQNYHSQRLPAPIGGQETKDN